METIDNRASLIELDEIYKYKNLIELSDKDVIKKIIFKGDMRSKGLYSDFIRLVADEVDHQLNKAEFAEEKKKRSMTSVMNKIAKLIHAYEQEKFEEKFFYKTCGQWCSYFGICPAAQEDTWL